MKVLIASTLFLIFLILAIIHLYWSAGGKWGANAAIPTSRENKKQLKPGLVSCFIVASGLLGFGIFCLIKAGMISYHLPGWLLNCGLWMIAVIFFLRALGDFKYVGFLKKIKTTEFGKSDTKYYSPLCLFIAVSLIILQLIA